MISSSRVRAASRAAAVHFFASSLTALVVALLIFCAFPAPYDSLAGGRTLVLLVIAVDVICGPLLTLVLFDPRKSRAELWCDLSLVVLVQAAAMSYGLWTAWESRPLYLVHEIDRFKVIAAVDIDVNARKSLPKALQPNILRGPLVVSIRPPKSDQERKDVLFESVQGGRDYAERPDFYIPYDRAAGMKALERARPLSTFLERYPLQQASAQKLCSNKGLDLRQCLYLPVMGRRDWVAVLNPQGQIEGFLPGDGF